jgi:hypothetical protein
VVQFVTFPGSNQISYGINTCKSTIAQTSYDLLNAATVNEGQNYGVFVNGVLATPSTVTITPIGMPTYFTLNSNYTITAAPNTPLGVYNFQVKVCATGFTTGCTIIDVRFEVISSLRIGQSTIYLTKTGRALTAPNLSTTLNIPVSNLTQVVRFNCSGSTAVTTSNINVTNVVIPPTSNNTNIRLNPTTLNFERLNTGMFLQRNLNILSSGLWTMTCDVRDLRPGFTNNTINLTISFDVNPNISRMANPNVVKIDAEYISDDIISVYPNPSSGIFNIQFNPNNVNKTNIEIYNLIGQKVYEKLYETKNVEELNLSHLSKGTYIVKASTGEDLFNTKIILE